MNKRFLFSLALIGISQMNIRGNTTLEAMLDHPRPLANKIIIASQGKVVASIITGEEDLKVAKSLQKAFEKKYQVNCPILKDVEINPAEVKGNIIVLGNLASNKVSEYLYRTLYTYEDRYFPGKQGYVVRTLLDPLGTGTNLIVLGGSTQGGVKNAVNYFLKQLKDEKGLLFIQPQLKVVWGNKPGKLNKFPWQMTAGRGPLNFAVKYLRTGDEKYAQQYKQALFKYMKKPSHLYSYYGTMLWDVMETSGAFSDSERLEISNKLLQFLRGEQGISYLTGGYIKQMGKAFRQPRVLGNHQTRALMGMYFGWRYFEKYFSKQISDAELAKYYQTIADIMDLQLSSYRSLDEAYSQHGFGATLDNTLVIAIADPKLMKNYLKSGMAKKMGDYVFAQCNNRGRMPANGDGGGIAIPANIFAKLAYLYQDGRYIFMANMAGNSAISTDEPIRGFFTGLKSLPPKNHLGVFAVAPAELNLAVEAFEDYTRLLSYDEKQFDAKSFDKLSFRGGLKKDSPYLLIDGIGGFSHAYSDQNSIVEFSKDNFTWVCEPDEFSYSSIDCHNSLTYTVNGIGAMKVPVAAKLLMIGNTENFSYSLTALPEYGDAAWFRHVLFLRNNGPFLVLDMLKSKKSGNYQVALHWHLLGEAKFNSSNIKVTQRSRDNKNQGEFSLDYPQNAGIKVSHSEDPKRLKMMKRNIILDNSTKFYPVILSKETKLNKGEMTGFLSMLRSDKKSVLDKANIIQLSELAYLLNVNGEKFIVATPDVNGVIVMDNLKIKADFALVGKDQLLLVNPVFAKIGEYDFAKKSAKGVQEINVKNVQVKKLLKKLLDDLSKQGKAQKAPEKKSITTGLKVITPVKQLKVDAPKQMSVLKNAQGKTLIAIGSYNGEITLLDRELKLVKRSKIKSQIMSMTTGDLNGDGVPELLIGTENGWLCCLDADLKLRWQINIPQQNRVALWYSLGRNQIVTLKVAELKNKIPMIFAGMGDSTLQAVSADGKMLWNKRLEWGISHKLAVGNFLAGKEKLLAAGVGIVSMNAKVYYLNASGKIESSINIPAGNGSAVSDMISGNFSSDSATELIVGTNSGFTGLYQGQPDGKISAIWEQNLDQFITGTLVVPSKKEKNIFVISSKNGFVHGFTMGGKQLWSKKLLSPVIALMKIKERQMVVATLADGTAVILDVTGKLHGKIVIKENISKFYTIDAHTLLILCDNNLYLINLPR